MAYRDPFPSARRTSGRLDMGACGRQFSSTRAVTPGGPVARPRHNVLATPLPHTLDRRGGSQEGNPIMRSRGLVLCHSSVCCPPVLGREGQPRPQARPAAGPRSTLYWGG